MNTKPDPTPLEAARDELFAYSQDGTCLYCLSTWENGPHHREDCALVRFGAAARAAGRAEVEEALREALINLIVCRDECLPHVQGAEMLAHVHGWRWQGPENGMLDVVTEARRALSTSTEATS